MSESGKNSNRIAIYLEQRQRKLAEWLNHNTAKLSPKNMLFSLVIFCLVFGGYLLYVLLEAFEVIN